MTRAGQVYGFDSARWLARRVPEAEIDWRRLGDRADLVFPPILARVLSGAESDAIDSEALTSRELVDAVRGSRSALSWLIARIDERFARRTRRLLWRHLALPLRVPRTRTGQPPVGLPQLRRAVASSPAALAAALACRPDGVVGAGMLGAKGERLDLLLPPRARSRESAWASIAWDRDGRAMAIGAGRVLAGRITIRFDRRLDPSTARRLARLHARAFRRSGLGGARLVPLGRAGIR